MLVIVYFLSDSIYNYLYWRFYNTEVEDGTTNLKFYAFDFLLNSDIIRLIFGSGFYVNDCFNCESIQDVGLLFNIFFQMGLMSLVVVFIILRLSSAFGIVGLVFLLALFVSKMFIFSVAFWFSVIVIGYSKKSIEKR